MTRMENKDIHAINMELLTHIDGFCRENNICYFLDSGTLLGAARNGEFIPWDDDADIVMPRPDYDRFVAEYIDSAKYRLYAPSRGNCFLPYARLCEMKRTYFKQVAIWTKENPGVGVDIIPLDGAPDTPEEFDKLATKLVRVRDRIWELRAVLSDRSIAFRKSLFGFAKDVVHYTANKIRRINAEKKIWQCMSKMRKLRLGNSYTHSSNCFYIVVTGDRRKYWEKKWFADVVHLALCGKTFPAPIGYKDRLTAEYGDWCTPPPESERSGHVSCQTMYWRDK